MEFETSSGCGCGSCLGIIFLILVIVGAFYLLGINITLASIGLTTIAIYCGLPLLCLIIATVIIIGLASIFAALG